MTTPLLSPHEIATFLLDSGWIDKGEADRLEKRIAAYSDSRASEGRNRALRPQRAKRLRLRPRSRAPISAPERRKSGGP